MAINSWRYVPSPLCKAGMTSSSRAPSKVPVESSVLAISGERDSISVKGLVRLGTLRVLTHCDKFCFPGMSSLWSPTEVETPLPEAEYPQPPALPSHHTHECFLLLRVWLPALVQCSLGAW